MQGIVQAQSLTAEEYGRLMEVWESAVRETHAFLTENNIQELKPVVREGLDQVALYLYRDEAGVIQGFLGVDGDKIEMLFVHGDTRGQGVGKRLARYAMDALGALHLDVNQQNPQAIGFYRHMGFRVMSRSPLDGQGNPFPLLHMSLPKALDVEILPATPEDAPELIRVQNESFYDDYLHYGVCPGYGHTLENMTAMLALPGCRAYKILLDGRTVGDILAEDKGGGAFLLGCICIVPPHQGKGIGSLAMEFLRREFSDALHWALETPADKEENISFYRKYGFRRTGTAQQEGVKLVVMEWWADKG